MPSDKEIERTDLQCALEVVNYLADGAPYGIERHAAIIRDAYLSMKAERDKLKSIVDVDTEMLNLADSFVYNYPGMAKDYIGKALAMRDKE